MVRKIVFLMVVATASVSAQSPATAKPKAAAKQNLAAEAKVSEAQARTTALAAFPDAKVKSSELEREEGKLIWTFDLKTKGAKGIDEVHVDALTGKLLSKEHESKKEYKKEKKAKKKAAKKPDGTGSVLTEI